MEFSTFSLILTSTYFRKNPTMENSFNFNFEKREEKSEFKSETNAIEKEEDISLVLKEETGNDEAHLYQVVKTIKLSQPLSAKVKLEKVPCQNCKKSYRQLYPHLMTTLKCQKGYDMADEKIKYSAHKVALTKKKREENPEKFLEHNAKLQRKRRQRKKEENPEKFLEENARMQRNFRQRKREEHLDDSIERTTLESRLSYKKGKDPGDCDEEHIDLKLPCQHCDKTFRSQKLLKVHTMNHTHPKDAEGNRHCEHCNYINKRAEKLMTHIQSVHLGLRPHLCESCPASFKTRFALNTHKIRVHENVRTIPCTYCEKMFHSKHDLVIHVRTHTGEKPYTCDECGKSFSDRSYFAVHKRIHNNKKEYVCHICSKSFVTNSYLRGHLKTHNDKPDKPDRTRRRGKVRIFTHEFRLSVLKRVIEIGPTRASKESEVGMSTLNSWIQLALRTEKYKCHHCDRVHSNVRDLNRHLASTHSKHKEATVKHIYKQSFKQEVALFATQNSIPKASNKYKISVATVHYWMQRHAPGGIYFSETADTEEVTMSFSSYLAENHLLPGSDFIEALKEVIETRKRELAPLASQSFGKEKEGSDLETLGKEEAGLSPNENTDWDYHQEDDDVKAEDNIDEVLNVGNLDQVDNEEHSWTKQVEDDQNYIKHENVQIYNGDEVERSHNDNDDDEAAVENEKGNEEYQNDIAPGNEMDPGSNGDMDEFEDMPVKSEDPCEEEDYDNYDSNTYSEEDGVDDMEEFLDMTVKTEDPSDDESNSDLSLRADTNIEKYHKANMEIISPKLDEQTDLKEEVSMDSEEKHKGGKKLFDRSGRCEPCDRFYLNLYNHNAIKHSNKKWKRALPPKVNCDFCGKQLSCPEQLKVHQSRRHWKELEKAGIPVKTFSCNECPQVRRTQKDLNRHMREVHGPDPKKESICEHCGKSFKLLRYLKQHEAKMHGVGKNYKKKVENGFPCPHCDACFGFNDLLSRHVQSAHENVRFQCKECSKQFRDKNGLVRHQRLKHEDPKFQCDECPKKFREGRDLMRHKRVHAGELRSETLCEVCEKEFSDMQSLREHQRKHTGPPRKRENVKCPEGHTCDICGNNYKWECLLKNHIDIVHNGQKNFPCDICGKLFSRFSTLDAHRRIHGAKQFNCIYCDSAYGEKRNLMNHIKRSHPGCELRFKRITPKGEAIMDDKTSLNDVSLTPVNM